jgi:hypothetical protein
MAHLGEEQFLNDGLRQNKGKSRRPRGGTRKPIISTADEKELNNKYKY